MSLNRKRTLTLVVASVFLIAWSLSPQPAAAWGPGGHRVVANIAFDRLDQATRSNIVKVICKHPDFDDRFAARMPEDIKNGNAADRDRWIFLQAAIWPDLIRPVHQYHKETWHFMNLPFFLTTHDKAVLHDVIKPNVSMTLPNPLTPAAKEHLNCVQAFKLCVRGLSDADSTDEEKAIYYCWLLHIAGDIHQPLHSTSLVTRGRFHTSEGDRGGNGIKIKQGRNLHSYWDGLLGGDQSLNDIKGRTADIIANADLKKAAEKAAEELDVAAWIQESNKLAKTFVYDEPIKKEVAAREADSSQPLQKVVLPEVYLKEAGRIAQRRVAEAGYRLAEILKQIEDN
ncbi:MAG: S1/P1 nuclease [Planctomycetes bacterium]|nr:S1/P1 nuclease [Planctomycetota bacterium]